MADYYKSLKQKRNRKRIDKQLIKQLKQNPQEDAIQSLVFHSELQNDYNQQWAKTKKNKNNRYESCSSQATNSIKNEYFQQKFHNFVSGRSKKQRKMSQKGQLSLRSLLPKQVISTEIKNQKYIQPKFISSSAQNLSKYESVNKQIKKQGAMIYKNPKLKAVIEQKQSQQKCEITKIKIRHKKDSSSHLQRSLLLKNNQPKTHNNVCIDNISEKLRKMSLPWIKQMPKNRQNRSNIQGVQKIQQKHKNRISNRKQKDGKKICFLSIKKADNSDTQIRQQVRQQVKQGKGEILKKWLKVNKPKQNIKITSLLRQHFQLQFRYKKNIQLKNHKNMQIKAE